MTSVAQKSWAHREVSPIDVERTWLAGTRRKMNAKWVRWSVWHLLEGTLCPLATSAAQPQRLLRFISESKLSGLVDWHHIPFYPKVNPLMERVWIGKEAVSAPWFVLSAGMVPLEVVDRAWRQGDLRYSCSAPVIHEGEVTGILTWFDDERFDENRRRLAATLGQQAGSLKLVTPWNARAFLLDPARSTDAARSLAGAKAMLQVEDRVRREIAERLHGRVQSTLLVAAERVRSCATSLRNSVPEMAAELDSVLNLLDNVREQEIRELSHRLHPSLIQLGLRAALFGLAGTWAPNVDVRVHVDQRVEAADAPIDNQIPEEIRLAAYRVVEEGVTNARRHGEANRVDVSLYLRSKGLIVRVCDNGRGFVSSEFRLGFGLSQLGARVESLGGSWRIKNLTAGGAELIARIPCTAT